jgi:hypothetical protein
MNIAYVGSIAERKMHFSSSVDVVINTTEEPFNVVSVYVPLSLAAASIVDFNPVLVSAEKPAIYLCDVQNYREALKGKLLDQWQSAFRDDTNVDLVLCVIVFLDDDSTADMWDIDDASIAFEPLTNAFKKLFFVSYIKTLYDETYAGTPVLVPATPGTRASALVRVSNPTGSDITVLAASYALSDGVKNYTWTVSGAIALTAGAQQSILLEANDVGIDANLAVETNMDTASVLPSGLTASCESFTQGTDAQGEHEAPSKYFDLALALAYQGKGNIARSLVVTPVKTSFVDQKPNPADTCWIRYKTPTEQKEAMTSLLSGDRSKYFWAALYLMGIENAWCLIHSEPVNILPLVLEAWFAERNSSGTYVGNKMSMLRLSGTRIKPYGYPSWLYSDVNENDAAGFDQLDEMNVGYLSTIADNTAQDCALSSARGVTGTPVAALMISKFIDYKSAQQTAIMLSDAGTLTDPKLTDEASYRDVQALIASNIGLFAMTNGRLYNVIFTFPPFSVAKKGLTELVADSSWSATYKDDLDTVTVTGRITAL